VPKLNVSLTIRKDHLPDGDDLKFWCIQPQASSPPNNVGTPPRLIGNQQKRKKRPISSQMVSWQPLALSVLSWPVLALVGVGVRSAALVVSSESAASTDRRLHSVSSWPPGNHKETISIQISNREMNYVSLYIKTFWDLIIIIIQYII